MIKKFYLLSFALLALFFVSCEETAEVSKYDNWQARNESFIDSIANVYDSAPNNGGLKRFELTTAPGDYIYYKVKAAGDQNGESPKYLDYVKVHFKLTNILNEYLGGTFTGSNPIIGDVENEGTGEGDSVPAVLQTKISSGYNDEGYIIGWVETLQRMKKGDRWEVYLPWKYSYGSAGKDQILGYSTLVYDMILLDFASNQADLED